MHYYIHLNVFEFGGHMNIKEELIQNYICDMIKNILQSNLEITKIADTTAINIISKIKNVIADESLSDFDAIEEIVCILEKNNIDCGGRHDF